MQQHQLDRGSFSTATSYSTYGGGSIGGWPLNSDKTAQIISKTSPNIFARHFNSRSHDDLIGVNMGTQQRQQQGMGGPQMVEQYLVNHVLRTRCHSSHSMIDVLRAFVLLLCTCTKLMFFTCIESLLTSRQ